MQTQANSLYYNIYTDIKEQILHGELNTGDRLPSEAELEKLYGASRAPVRQALAMLEQEAFLLRRQGRGTFVTDRRKQSHWLFSSGFSKDIERDFDSVSSKTLWVRMEKPDDDVKQVLALSDDQQVIHIHRLRYLKDIPMFSMHNYVRGSLGIEVFKRAGDFFIISEILEGNFHIVSQRAEEEIRAASADDVTSEELQVPAGFPLLNIKRVYYTANDKTVYMSRYQVRTDYWSHKTIYYTDD
ncbi:MAG: GntR family transcriptional regulator [Synergistaceae bacterium]|jgi:GntR family transcriptional regulator|nr:GntR family transcriptional regulator [Synergistaceae bacterium]